MKVEIKDEIIDKLKNSGFGYISNDELEKIVRLVWSKLVFGTVFQPLENTSGIADITIERARQN